MSTPATTPLYRESVAHATSTADIDRALAELSAGCDRWHSLHLRARALAAEDCLHRLPRHADHWVALACQHKQIPLDSSAVSEEWAGGPMATARYLQLIVRTLSSIDLHDALPPPGPVSDAPAGRLRMQVFPSRQMFDATLFHGFQAWTWFEPGVTRANIAECLPTRDRLLAQPAGISLVLGAGNVSSIAPTDAFERLFHAGQAVLLKLNPVNDYLGEVFEQVLAPLIELGVLRIIYGGADVGRYAARHARVDHVHLTGSAAAQTALTGEPGFDKPLTSELGNVTPWIVVPGSYTTRELAFQAENVASMIVNNASFNCIATKMIVTWRDWPQRELFLSMLDDVLTRTPRRVAYYPGAHERYRRFAETDVAVDDSTLPWTLRKDVNPAEAPHLFGEESFVCVTAETALEAPTPEAFLDRAVDFANEQLWGTLGAGLMVPSDFRRGVGNQARLGGAVARLDYGTVAINHWPGLSYALMTTPWGGSPRRGTPDDPQSGSGWVHNTYLLDRIEKCVLEGPLVVWPKPLWFPSHRQATRLARRVFGLDVHPHWWRLPGVMLAATGG